MLFKGKEYNLKPTVRAMVIFESIMGCSFNPKLLTHNIIYFYSVLMAAAPDSGITLDEFYNEIDNDSTLIGRMSEELSKKEIPTETHKWKGASKKK